MGEVLSTPQVRICSLTGGERGEQLPIPTEQRDRNRLIPTPFGGSKGEAALWVQTDDTGDLVQAPVSPGGKISSRR
jgi:hypothetical protein